MSLSHKSFNVYGSTAQVIWIWLHHALPNYVRLVGWFVSCIAQHTFLTLYWNLLKLVNNNKLKRRIPTVMSVSQTDRPTKSKKERGTSDETIIHFTFVSHKKYDVKICWWLFLSFVRVFPFLLLFHLIASFKLRATMSAAALRATANLEWMWFLGYWEN